MARKEIIVMVCDKCGFEDTDASKFRTVIIQTVAKKPKVESSRDLCEGCLGMPGVNRDK